MGPAKFPIKRVVMKYFPVSDNSTSARQENLFQGQVPTRVIVGCVSSNAFDGSHALNPFNFQHFHINYINLTVKGVKNPIKPITPNFPHQSLTGFHSLLLGLRKWGRDEGVGFRRNDYPYGYCLFAWDLTPDQSDSSDHFQLVRNSGVRLDMKFQNPLEDPINVIVYAEFENMIMVDADRNVTANFLM